MPDLTLLNQVLDRSGDIFDGHVGIEPVLVEEINDVGPEALERGVGNFFYVLRTTIKPSLLAIHNVESELGRNRHLLAQWSNRFADEFFIREGSINFSRVEEGDAALHGCADN